MVSPWVTGALQGFEKGFAQQELAKNKAISQAILLKELQRKTDEDARKESVRQKQKQFFTDYPKYQGKIDDLTKQYGSAKTETALRQLPKIQAQAKERESLESLDWGSEFGFDLGVAPKYQKEKLTVPQAEKRALQEDIKSIVGQGVKGIEETTRKKRAKIEKDIKELRSLIISAAGGAELPEFAKNFAKGITTQLFQKPKTQKQIDKDLIKQSLLNNKTMSAIDKLAIRTGKYKYNVNQSLNRAAFTNELNNTSRFIDIAMGPKQREGLEELKKVDNTKYENSFAGAFRKAYGLQAGLKRVTNQTLGQLFGGVGEYFSDPKTSHAKTFASLLENDLFDIFTADKDRRVFKTEINNIKSLLPTSFTKRTLTNTTAVIGSLAKIQQELEKKHTNYTKQLTSGFISANQKSKIYIKADRIKSVLQKLGPFSQLYESITKKTETSEQRMIKGQPQTVPVKACGKNGYLGQRQKHLPTGNMYVCTMDGWAREKK